MGGLVSIVSYSHPSLIIINCISDPISHIHYCQAAAAAPHPPAGGEPARSLRAVPDWSENAEVGFLALYCLVPWRLVHWINHNNTPQIITIILNVDTSQLLLRIELVIASFQFFLQLRFCWKYHHHSSSKIDKY